MNNGQVVADVYRVAIDSSKSPPHIDWLRRDGSSTTPEYVGIVKRKGNQVLITFISGSTNRAANFDTMPSSTCLITAHK